MKSFTVVHHDGAIKVRIEDDGYAILEVEQIQDHEIVVRAINQAFKEGALRGTLFTNEIVNDRLAQMHVLRAEQGLTWLGGKVTRLADGVDGPCFRIDWVNFPYITE